jgi:hypothetical protein
MSGVCTIATVDKLTESKIKKISPLGNDHVLVKLSALDAKLLQLQSDIVSLPAGAKDTNKSHRMIVRAVSLSSEGSNI